MEEIYFSAKNTVSAPTQGRLFHMENKMSSIIIETFAAVICWAMMKLQLSNNPHHSTKGTKDVVSMQR